MRGKLHSLLSKSVKKKLPGFGRAAAFESKGVFVQKVVEMSTTTLANYNQDKRTPVANTGL